LRWLAFMVVLFAGATALAEDDVAIARAHYRTGVEYYDRHQYTDAVHEFVAAHRVTPRPELLFNIAQAYDKVPDPGRAYAYYERYLAERPDAAERAVVELDLSRLRPHVGALVVETPSGGGEVTVDGAAVEGPGQKIWLSAGGHVVAVHRPGTVDATARVQMRGGQSLTVRLDPLTPEGLIARDSRRRARWVWPVVGVTIAVVAAAAIGLGVGLTRRDYTDEGRGACTGACVLVEPVKASR
jgi:tetratricopeptide (TPR) repeat protein